MTAESALHRRLATWTCTNGRPLDDTPLMTALRRYARATATGDLRFRRLHDELNRRCGFEILDEEGTVIGKLVREPSGRLVRYIAGIDGFWFCREVIGHGRPMPQPSRSAQELAARRKLAVAGHRRRW